MKATKILLFLLAVAVMAGLGFFLLGGGGQGGGYVEEAGVEVEEEAVEGAEAPTETGEAAVVVAGNAGRQVLEASFEDEREPPQYEKALSGITGRILMDEDGKPVPDLEVALAEVHFDSISPSIEGLAGLVVGRKPALIRGRVRTDAEGRFRFRRLHSRAFHLLVIGPRTDKVGFRFLPHGMPVGGDMDLGDIRLVSRGSIEGKLVDEEGQAVVGATIRAVDIPQIIAGFGIARLDPKGTLLVNTGSINLTLSFPEWIRELEKDLPFPVTKSRSDGSFRLDGVAPGQQTILVLPKEGLALSKTTRVRAHKVARFRKIKIKSGETLTGSCVDKAGKAVAQVQVRSGERMGPSPFSFLGPAVSSDEQGRFRLKGAGRNKNHVVFRRDDESPWIHAGEFRPGDAIRIEVPSLGAGRVKVLDSKGKIVPGVELTMSLAHELVSMTGFESKVDLEGRLAPIEGVPGSWRIKDLEEGPYRVLARSEGYSLTTGRLTISASQENELELTLQKAPTYRFEVVDQSQRPVAGARIYWDPGRSRARSKTRVDFRVRLSGPAILLGKTNGEGTLMVEHVERGASSFSVRHPAFALGSSGKDILGAQTRYRFVLTEAATVVGQVRDGSRGKKKRYSVMAEPSRKLRRSIGDVMMPRIVATDSEGRFKMDGLTPGEWRFQLLPDFFSPTRISEYIGVAMEADRMHKRVAVTLFAGRETRVVLSIGQDEKRLGNGILEGIVTLNGRPRKGLAIRARGKKGSRSAVTDDLGRFRIVGLPQTKVYVSVIKGDLRNLERSNLWGRQVDLGKTPVFHLSLNLEAIRARLLILDVSGEPLEAIRLVLNRKRNNKAPQDGSATYRGLSDTEGLVRIDDVIPGTYSIDFDYNARSRGIVLPKNKTVQITQGGSPIRITAEKALQLSGRVEWVLHHLDPKEKRAFDAQMAKRKRRDRSSWIEIGGGWSQLEAKEGVWRFSMKGLRRGTHVARSYRDGITWFSQKVELNQDHTDILLQMKPNQEQIKRWVSAMDKAEQRGQRRK